MRSHFRESNTCRQKDYNDAELPSPAQVRETTTMLTHPRARQCHRKKAARFAKPQRWWRLSLTTPPRSQLSRATKHHIVFHGQVLALHLSSRDTQGCGKRKLEDVENMGSRKSRRLVQPLSNCRKIMWKWDQWSRSFGEVRKIGCSCLASITTGIAMAPHDGPARLRLVKKA
jgi:hypothetical protein